MAIIDNVAVLTVHTGAAALQGHEPCAADEDIETVVVKAHAQAMSDQA